MKQFVMNKLGSTVSCAVGLHSWCDGWVRPRVPGELVDLHACECARCRHAMLARAGVIHTGRTR